jgi:hypothetical protein
MSKQNSPPGHPPLFKIPDERRNKTLLRDFLPFKKLQVKEGTKLSS